jgi:hypothetical protein
LFCSTPAGMLTAPHRKLEEVKPKTSLQLQDVYTQPQAQTPYEVDYTLDPIPF